MTKRTYTLHLKAMINLYSCLAQDTQQHTVFRVARTDCVYHLKFAWPQSLFCPNLQPFDAATTMKLILTYLNPVDALFPTSLRSILISAFSLHLSHVRGLLHSGVPTNILCSLLTYTVHGTCKLDNPNRTIWLLGKKQKLWNSSLRIFLHPLTAFSPFHHLQPGALLF